MNIFSIKSLSVKALPFILSVLLPINISAKTSKTFCFLAEKDDAKIYLLGSIHMANEKMYPLPAVIENGFTSSSALVVEADINSADQTESQKIILEKGMYQDDKDLTKILSASEYKELKFFSESVGMPIEMISKMKPWLAVLTLSMLKAQKEGLRPELGIDMHFLKLAKDSKKILELEGVLGQIELLSSFSDEEQKQFLKYTIKSEKENKNELNDIIAAWKTGNTNSLEKLLLSAFKETPAVEKKFLFDRNDVMTKKIIEFLSDDKKLFVVVGAAHLIGQKGILNQLKNKGFAVKQLDK